MTKITSMPALAGAGVDPANDLLPIVDVSAAGLAKNKNITVAQLAIAMGVIAVVIDNDTSMAADSATSVPSQHAVKSAIAAAVAGLINAAPGALDTLKELADAIGDDSNFAATVATALAQKLGLAGGTLTGPLQVPEDAYAAGWNGSAAVPTKNAVYDKIEAIIAGIPGSYSDEQAQDAVAAAFAAGTHTNITVTYNDAGNAISLAVSGIASYSDEQAQDAVAAMLAAGTQSGLTVTYNDAGNSMSLAVTLRTTTTQSSTAYTAVLADAANYIRFTNASAVTFTIPPNSSVAFPVDTVIEGIQAGAGALTLAPGAGVTINSRAADLTLAGQFGVFSLKKVATDTWDLTGDL